ncbi:MAG: class I SAM-dependent methyltransferase [Rhodobacter sp.]|nr:class I SAM-dependent methyltransferase [Rhodobacter sp.]
MCGDPSKRSDAAAVLQDGSDRQHRAEIGGMWEEIGALQLEFLKAQGLKPDHHLLDIGCGSLRLGCKVAPYLNPGNYWGTDRSRDLIDAGYDREIVPAGLGQRLPRTNLVTDGIFDFPGAPDTIDYAMAQSVFTHLPLNHLRLCLANLARRLVTPCRFYFLRSSRQTAAGRCGPCLQKDGITTWSYKDPFHYDLADIRHAARDLPWALRLVGDWAHPRNQMMVEALLDREGMAHPPGNGSGG